MDLNLPKVTAKRGGIKFGEARIPASDRTPRPPRDPRGCWHFGVDIADYSDGDTEQEIVSGSGGWGSAFEPYLTAEEALADWPGRDVFKRWVPAPGPWTAVS